MKKSIILGTLAVCGLGLTSCDDFLNDNRFPESKQTVNAEFWSNAVNVENQINYFYENFVGYGNGTGAGNFYWNTLTDDQAGYPGQNFKNWTFTNVPASSSSWNSPYVEIRRACNVIEGVEGSSLETTTAEDFLAKARMYRAWQYYKLVRAYGDVPLVEKALDVTDEGILYGPRTNRNVVMDAALADLNYAINHITTKANKNTFSRDMILAMKAEVCLFEASYQQYVAKNMERAKQFYNEVVSACTPLLSSYTIGSDYRAIYSSMRAELEANPEIIFMKAYEETTLMHSLLDWTSSSTPVCGITKDAFDSYLFLDGKPLASTTMDKSDKGEMVEEGGNNYLSIAAPLATRDKRLSQTIYPYVMYRGSAEDAIQDYKFTNTARMTSTTGYGVFKYNNLTQIESDVTTANRNWTSAPLFWLAEIALDYVEAKAELGTLNDNDLTNTLNKLYARAGLPAQTVAGLSSINDPANNMGVPSLIWEIRRCRRCEFIMDNDIRYWDLVRWNQLERLDTQKNPNIVLGANITPSPVEAKNVNGYLDCSFGMTRTYTNRYDLYPIPSGQLNLNPELGQNPGW